MNTARDIAHASGPLSDVDGMCNDPVQCEERHGEWSHIDRCDEMTDAIRAAQIDALRWALHEVGEVRVPVTLYLTIKAQLAELEREGPK